MKLYSWVIQLSKCRGVFFWLISAMMCIDACSQKERRFCGNPQPHDISEIEKQNVFSQTKEIKIVSFKREYSNLSDRIVINAAFERGMVYEIETLDEGDRDGLLGVLANFDLQQAPSTNGIKATVLFCYNPRNAILLFNDQSQIVGYIEICFECFGYKTYPASLKIGTFCDEKFEVIKELFQDNGVRYGLDMSKEGLLEEWRECLKKEWDEASSHHPLSWMAVAKLEMDSENFDKAIKCLNNSIRLDSANWHAYFMRGHSYFMREDFENARRDFTRVLKLHPVAAEANRERALSTIKSLKARRMGICCQRYVMTWMWFKNQATMPFLN